jgi:hypothetical protein
MNNRGGLIVTAIYTLVILVVGIFIGVWAVKSLGNVQIPFFSPLGVSLSPPGNYFLDKDIHVYPESVSVDVKGAQIASYDSTGSMNPILYEGAHGIVVAPKNESEIKVGDIVSYTNGENTIVHRVIEKGNDEGGVYFVVKGDNSSTSEIIRFNQIEHKVVGILY